MALIEKKDAIIKHVLAKQEYLKHNRQLLEIYEGDLLPKVLRVLSASVNDNYFKAIKDRVLPINILQRYINKVATIYNNPPVRTSEKDQDIIDFYVDQFKLDQEGNTADEYAALFKGYAWEPFVHKDRIRLRTLPYDRFMVFSDDPIDPLAETVFVKIMGKREDGELDLWVYTDEEFMAFNTKGELDVDLNEMTGGRNAFGIIPFVYGNRSKTSLVPIQDNDILQMSLMFPVMETDLAGAIMFQAFAIIYGIDIDTENAIMAPNALWSFKSDPESDKTPVVGTIKPQVDIDSVMNFIKETFIMWLETKGIRVGSMGSTNSTSQMSGISKIIDEMDIYDVKVKAIQAFENDEQELWEQKLPKMHNTWLEKGLIKGMSKLPEDGSFKVDIEFEKPLPMKPRIEVLNEIKMEQELGVSTPEMDVRKANPTANDPDVQEILEVNGGRNVIEVPNEFDLDNEASGEIPGAGVDVEAEARKRTALNGAQITAIVTIVKDVAAGNLPREAAINMIMTGFNLSRAEAEALLGQAGLSFKLSKDEV